MAARFLSRRLTAFVGWLAFGLATVDVLTDLGFSLAGRELVAYVLGLGLVVIALNAVWRRPAAPDQDVEGPLPETHRLGPHAQNTLLSIGIVLLWGLWVARAMPSFWLILVIITLPLANSVIRRVVEHLLRPTGGPTLASAITTL